MTGTGGFDPEDKYSWFFGSIERDETNRLLDKEVDGTFLVRESQRIRGDLVLCVKEGNKISHYIINRINQNDTTSTVNRYKIGEQEFTDMPSLLGFYKTHYLDTSALIKPVEIVRQKVRCKYDFPGRDPEDLPFKKGEILEIILKDEDKWWTARNEGGQVGQIPVPYVELWNPSETHSETTNCTSNTRQSSVNQQSNAANIPRVPSEVSLPAWAVAVMDRTPNAYDRSQLKFKKGDRILVTKIDLNGQWTGELQGNSGMLPMAMVRLVDVRNQDGGDHNASSDGPS